MKLSIVCSYLLTAVCLISATAAAEATKTEREEIVVTATKQPVSLDNLAVPVEVISRNDIRQLQPVDLSDLLARLAGIEMARNGGAGGNASIFTRGAESDHTILLINGIRVNPSSGFGGANWQFIDPATIERIEIVKGPRAALYGSDAIAGVVNVITKVYDRASVLVGGGSYDTRKLQLGGSADLSGIRVEGQFALTDSGGFNPKKNSASTGAYDNQTVNIAARNEGKALQWELSFRQAEGETEYDNSGSQARQAHTERVASGTLGWRSDTWNTNLRYSFAQNKLNQLGGSPDRVTTERDQIELNSSNKWQIGDQLLAWQAGASHQSEDVYVCSFCPFSAPYASAAKRNEVYTSLSQSGELSDSLIAIRYTDDEVYGDNFSWNAEYSYAMDSTASWYVMAGTAFKAPSAAELFSPSFGNADLREETSRSYELGLKVDNEIGSLGTAFFVSEIENLIVYSGSRLENVEKAEIRGIELTHSLTRGLWHLHNAVTLQRAEKVDANGSRSDLARRADLNWNFQLSWLGEAARISVENVYSGKRRDSAFSTAVLDSYSIVNVSAGWQLSAAWSLNAKVENLFGEEYEVAGGYNVPESSVFVSLSWALD